MNLGGPTSRASSNRGSPAIIALKTGSMNNLAEPFNENELLKYGDKLEISGMLLANGNEAELILFPEVNGGEKLTIVQPTHEQWKTLLYQLDTLGVAGLGKIILRKSQRNIEQTVSWNVFRRDSYTCQYCAKNDVPLTVDHIVLWEQMGASVESNLISACKKCNKTRANTEFPDWMKGEYLDKVMKAGFSIEGRLQQTAKFISMYEEAKRVPLRNTHRNR